MSRRCPVQICMQIRQKMEAGDCPTLNMNAMENYLLGHSLKLLFLKTEAYFHPIESTTTLHTFV